MGTPFRLFARVAAPPERKRFMSPNRTASLVLATLLLPLTAAAQTQSSNQLARENDRLRQELAQLKQQCPASGGGDESGAEQRAGDLSVAVSSVRVGPYQPVSNATGVTLTLQIRNIGPAPIALNYKQGSFGLVDNHGYNYELKSEEYFRFYTESIKGIPMAGQNKATTTNVLMPGATQRVMFIAHRYFPDGQSAGSTFDLSATFASFADRGQGNVEHLRDFPVAFVGLNRAPGIGISGIGNSLPSGRAKSSETLERVLRNVLGN